MGLVGLYLRRKTEEGPEFQALQRLREQTHVHVTPIVEASKLYGRRILVFTAFMGSWAVFATLLTNYLPTFLKANKAMTLTTANAANTLASVMVVIFVLLFSRVADRIGLRTALIIGCLVLIVGVIPGFAIAGNGLVGGFLGAAILGACKGILAVPMLLAVSQIFPAGIRVAAGGLSYNLSASILGGTAPFVAVWLNRISGSSLYFSAYLVFFGIVTLVITLIYAKKWVTESEVHSGDAANNRGRAREQGLPANA